GRDAFLDGGPAEQFITEYEYDPAGRKVVERGTQTGEQRFTLDKAGNVTAVLTPSGYTTQMVYDALGRLTRRIVPERVNARICSESTIVLGCQPFPRFPNHGDGYRVPEEWSFYRYDAAGNQVYAENADAIVARSYYPNGALRTDSTWIRPVQGLEYAAYGMRYAYDMAGRVTELEHPQNLSGGTQGTDRFFYDAVTGALGTARSRQGYDFTFHNDFSGQLTSMRLPGAIVDSMRYDVEGRLTWRWESGPAAGELHMETMQYDARGKLLMANNQASVFQNWYSGGGSLVGTDWRGLGTNVGRISEEFQLDPLGNVLLRRTSVGQDQQHGEMPRFENLYLAGTGRLFRSRKLPPTVPSSTWTPDETLREYDASGNVSRGYQQVGGIGSGGDGVIAREVESRSFYGADDRLRVFQTYDVRRTDQSNYENAGVWEEYRYDALGRRVLVRTRTDGGLCEVDLWTCTSSVTRFVWAGDNLLWELKQAEGSYAAQAGGNVSYFHAGGIDRPLVITKDGQSIIPHQNWRGEFARGTYPSGAKSDCPPGVTTGCTPIQWPGERTSARHELEPDPSIQNWFGGLVDGMRDASGQMYKRNRYYDPKTGQFTQPDPIGLAGGLNAYGFADGDPVTYSDPYGLSAQDNCLRNPSECVAAVRNWLHNTESGRFVVAVACSQGCVAQTDEAAVALRRAQEENP
ncbi:MAG TPA: RHS repeat-associated core domain-containing protein, partial [Longimicrobium sp.]|nr:RHS repeat-associated core domain-containing protein [Longimicrobium sp.]